MDLVLVLFLITILSFLSGFLLGMFLGDRYFILDMKRKDPKEKGTIKWIKDLSPDPIPEVKGTTKRIDIVA